MSCFGLFLRLTASREFTKTDCLNWLNQESPELFSMTFEFQWEWISMKSVFWSILLTVDDVELRQSCPAEVRPSLHIDETVFTLLLQNDLLDPRRPLVHKVPSSDTAVQSRVNLRTHTNNTQSSLYLNISTKKIPAHLLFYWSDSDTFLMYKTWQNCSPSAGWLLCLYVLGQPAYRFNDVVGAVGQTRDVDLRLQLAIDGGEETLGAVDAHYRLLADFHTDAALQFVHRDLCVTQHSAIICPITHCAIKRWHALMQTPQHMNPTAQTLFPS